MEPITDVRCPDQVLDYLILLLLWNTRGHIVARGAVNTIGLIHQRQFIRNGDRRIRDAPRIGAHYVGDKDSDVRRFHQHVGELRLDANVLAFERLPGLDSAWQQHLHAGNVKTRIYRLGHSNLVDTDALRRRN